MRSTYSKTFKDTLRHHLNPLHLYCYFRKMGFNVNIKNFAWYDKNLFQPLLG